MTWECVAFFKRNRKAILESLAELANDCGEIPSQALANFRRLKSAGITDPMAVLANTRHDDFDAVANALAWFALEACGRKFLDEEEG